LLDLGAEPGLFVALFDQVQAFADGFGGGLIFPAFHLAWHRSFEFGGE
jgi:hypothetical protein